MQLSLRRPLLRSTLCGARNDENMLVRSLDMGVNLGLPLLQERDKRVRLFSRIQNDEVSDTTDDEQNYQWRLNKIL